MEVTKRFTSLSTTLHDLDTTGANFFLVSKGTEKRKVFTNSCIGRFKRELSNRSCLFLQFLVELRDPQLVLERSVIEGGETSQISFAFVDRTNSQLGKEFHFRTC